MKNTYHHHIRFTAEKLGKRLPLIAGYIYQAHLPLAVEITNRTPNEKVPPQNADWKPIQPGDQWGGLDQWYWFRTSFHIPQEWQGKRVAARIVLSNPAYPVHAEAIAYLNEELRQGIDPNHHEILLSEAAQGGEQYDLRLAAWTTYWSHYFDRGVPNPDTAAFQAAELVQVHMLTRKFYHLAEVALGATRRISADSLDYHQILNALDTAYNLLNFQSAGHFYESLPAAMQALEEGLAKIPPSRAKILATGHAHIDVAWLWRLQNTREKSQHTFSTVLRLMEQYPDYQFTQSQAQLYAYLKEDAPHLLEQIRERVREGRWEVTGGMWVEPDMNLISGESIIRQIMYGRRFFREEVGEDTPILWLPDTFGYSWALPQIIKRSGMKYFMTSKISWNQYNRVPYDSFRWRGIDGTEIVTHFLTASGRDDNFVGTYNAMVTPEETDITFARYQQKDIHDEVLTTFGYGDGGGGPTQEMLERLDVMKNAPALPQVTQERAIDFFDRLNAKADKLPVWNSELYFEYHRGTYTSQARNKRNNRKAEVLYHRAEFIAAMATLVGHPYPHDLLREGWKLLLLNQFHDIIPGSSIRAVYEDSEKDYARIFEIGEQVIAEAVRAITPHLPLKKGEKGIFVVSSDGATGFGDAVETPSSWVQENEMVVGNNYIPATQREAEYDVYHLGGGGYYSWLFKIVSKENSASYAELDGAATVSVGEYFLNNDAIKAKFNALGEIVSLIDNKSLELIPSGALGNQFQAFEDRPMNWDAWDIDIFYDDKMYKAEPISFRIVENGPVRATLEFRKRILNSEITQYVSLHYYGNRLDFKTIVDWREEHTLLKVAFPFNLHLPHATFDIQFGHVQRPTHRNTSWDWARFESVAHKWVNLSESNASVSLLNDCKYGYDVHDNVIRLSLLRSPTRPDAKADQGRHEFTYSLVVDLNSKLEQTISRGYALNDPPQTFLVHGTEETLQPSSSFRRPFYINEYLMGSNGMVVIETVKAAENGEGLIVRLYEAVRSRGKAQLRIGFPIKKAWETNLLEENEQELSISSGDSDQLKDNYIELDFTPFQIRTIRVIPA